MDTLAIDIETYSDVSLPDCGVHRYAASEQFEILLFAYSLNDEPTKIIDLASGEKMPDEIMKLLTDDSVIKTAYNAAFERNCINRYFGLSLKPEGWRCTLVQASMLSLPLSLEGVGEALNLDKKKMSEGKELIRFFCMPCKPSKSNGGRTRNLPSDEPEKWELFKTYCIRDVDVEKQIRNKLSKFPIPDREQELYCMDQRINDRGIMVDPELITHAVACDLLYKETATKKAYEISGLENPNSVAQLKGWLARKGIEINSLAKAAVEELVENTDGDVAEMMKLRLALSKTSVKKYEAMERSVCPDGRVHGLLQFYGANRTGRWAGRLVQIHNLPQNHMEDLELARSIVKEGRYDLVELLYDSIPDVLSELIRTAFVAKQGCRFIVSDFSAIEARVMGYLAGEGWVMEEFRGAGKIYEQTASKMFHIPIEEITKGSPYRARGKVASLACQYGGAEGALISMGALNFVEEEELKGLVQSWRTANPHIVNYWYEIDGAVKAAVKERKMTKVGMVTVYYQSGMLKIALPSGRVLSYVRPRMTVNRFGSESVSYEGVGTNRKWTRIESYGAKFCENIVQATARDVLAEAMLRLEKKGFDIVCHIHDEVVLEVPEGTSSVEEVNEIMAVCPDWCEGLPLKAAGFESSFYKKD
jgi:DNA polymerase